MPLHDLDDGPPPGELQVWAYPDDGTIHESEYDMGTLHTTVTGLVGTHPAVSLDVTTLVQDYLANGHEFLALRFQGVSGSDRYELGASGGVPDPSITLVP